jgi:hypothetical protein
LEPAREETSDVGMVLAPNLETNAPINPFVPSSSPLNVLMALVLLDSKIADPSFLAHLMLLSDARTENVEAIRFNAPHKSLALLRTQSFAPTAHARRPNITASPPSLTALQLMSFAPTDLALNLMKSAPLRSPAPSPTRRVRRSSSAGMANVSQISRAAERLRRIPRSAPLRLPSVALTDLAELVFLNALLP